MAFTALLLLATEKVWPQKIVIHEASPIFKEKIAHAITWVEVTRQTFLCMHLKAFAH